MMVGQSEACQRRRDQLRPDQHAAPMGRVVLEAPLWPNDLRRFAGHGALCVHVVLPRARTRWEALFAGIRVLGGRTAHLRVHVQRERGAFSLDPAVLFLSGARRRREILEAVIFDAARAGVDLTPEQVHVETYAVTRSTLRLPPATPHALAWGVMCVAWFPLTGAPREWPAHGGARQPPGGPVMNCPHDGTALWVARRSGIEVDVCPLCRGVWLDRGELDKIIARADDPAAPRLPPSLPPFRTKPIQTLPPDAAETRPGNWLGDLFEDTPPPERAP